jgi:hypothetical protein
MKVLGIRNISQFFRYDNFLLQNKGRIMELKDFVKNTLVEIVEGLQSANEALASTSAFVASSNIKSPSQEWYGTCDSKKIYHYISFVDFDISVLVQDLSEKSKGGKINVAQLISVGGNGDQSSKTEKENRVKFKIPLALPTEPEYLKNKDE